jgi:peroxiredoxin
MSSSERSRGKRIAALAILLGLMGAVAPPQAPAQKMPPLPVLDGWGVGNRSYLFSLKDLSGQTYSLKELRGRRVVHVIFWATWCVPCVQEVPAMREIYRKYRDQGLEVLAVALDLNETKDGVLAIARDLKINYPILWDQDGQLMKRFAISVVPQNFLIGRDGIVRYAGVSLPGDYEALVQKLLHEGREDTVSNH